jgi:hypothetical protein
MDGKSMPDWERRVAPRIGIYERGGKKAIRWFSNYIDAAFEAGSATAEAEMEGTARIPYSVKVIVQQGLRSDDFERENRQHFVLLLDRVGMDYSVQFVEEEAGGEEGDTTEPPGPPPEPEAEPGPEPEDRPMEQDFESKLVELEEGVKSRKITRSQYKAQKDELLKSWREYLEKRMKE